DHPLSHQPDYIAAGHWHVQHLSGLRREFAEQRCASGALGDRAGGTGEIRGISIVSCVSGAPLTRTGLALWFLPPTLNSKIQYVRPLARRLQSNLPWFRVSLPRRAKRSTLRT